MRPLCVVNVAHAASEGLQLAVLIGAFFLLAAGAVALLARNTRQSGELEEEPALELAA